MRTRLFLLLSLLPLAACRMTSADDASLQSRLGNPLFAEQYWSELVDHFVNLQIQNDPLMKDPDAKEAADAARAEALTKAQEATVIIQEGIMGDFLSLQENVKGTALAVHGMLYFGTEFDAVPGGDMHVYVTNAVDPRDAGFPDASAADLGTLQSPYGTQEYALPEDKRQATHLTVVLWDEMLKRLHGFAQLRP